MMPGVGWGRVFALQLQNKQTHVFKDHSSTSAQLSDDRELQVRALYETLSWAVLSGLFSREKGGSWIRTKVAALY